MSGAWAAAASGGSRSGSPPAKLRRAPSPGAEEGASVEVEVEAEEAPSCPVGARVAGAVREAVRADSGSSASVRVGGAGTLRALSFQSGGMRRWLGRFPESLLLHRLRSARGPLLYAFLVESKERVARLAHLALLRDDGPEDARGMLAAFQQLNPEWRKVRVLFVDMSFPHAELLQDAFPAAQVLLSVYHTAQALERELRRSRAPSSSKQALKAALRTAVFSTSSASLETLSQQLKGLLRPDLHQYLQKHWFSCDMLWYMHAKKGLHSCSTYMDSLDLLTRKLCSLFGTQPSLERSVLRFLKYADFFNTVQGLEHLSRGLSGSEPRIEPLRTQAASKRGWQRHSDKPATGAPTQPTRPVATLLASLQETCTDLAYQLCLSEWDAVQTSTQLVNYSGSKTTVQLLEQEHQVSKDGLSCSCYFHYCYQLPCRHILSMLQETLQGVDDSMVGKRWRKYQHLSVLGGEVLPEGAGWSVGPYGAVAAASEERQDKIQALSKELGNLLLQSEGKELEVRISTLQMIVNNWTNCCELQE